ncbi:MAG: hypothetical protein AAF225_10030 [Pseudomonadota bacterium]
MSESWTPSRVRIAVARLCESGGIDLVDLYRALGMDAVAAESDAVAHLAGVIDGLEAAARDHDSLTAQ